MGPQNLRLLLPVRLGWDGSRRMSWASPSLQTDRPRLVFQSRRCNWYWHQAVLGRRGGGAEEPRACPLALEYRKGGLYPGSASRPESRKRAESTWELAGWWQRAQVTCRSSRPGVNPCGCPVCSVLLASAE